MSWFRYQFAKVVSRYAPNPPKHLPLEHILEEKGERILASQVVIKYPMVIDLSSWEIVTNWYLLSPRPSFIVLRATYGAYYIDRTYVSYSKGAYAAGYPTWGYHFLLYTQNWRAQADTFLRTVRSVAIHDDFVPVLDVEGYRPAGMTMAYANGMIENWLNYVEAQLGRRCAIYSSRNYLNQLYLYQAPLWLRNPARPKWIAGYPYNPNLYSSMPSVYVPVGLTKADILLWQYNANGIVRGITGGVDLNQVQRVV